VFLIQGQFLLLEDVKKCIRGGSMFCSEEITLPPKIHLLDYETDEFVEKKLDIFYQNFDYFEISTVA